MLPIAAAGALIQIVPQIARWLAGDKAGDAADKVLNVAKAVTGASLGEQAATILLSDPEKAAAFQEAMANMEAELDKEYLRDVQDARKRDVQLQSAGHVNWRANLLVALTFAVVFILMTLIWTFADVNDYVKGAASLLLGRFLGYLDSIFNFEFGTTRSSKEKDATILNLTK